MPPKVCTFCNLLCTTRVEYATHLQFHFETNYSAYCANKDIVCFWKLRKKDNNHQLQWPLTDSSTLKCIVCTEPFEKPIWSSSFDDNNGAWLFKEKIELCYKHPSC
jgi:hypothetical protein